MSPSLQINHLFAKSFFSILVLRKFCLYIFRLWTFTAKFHLKLDFVLFHSFYFFMLVYHLLNTFWKLELYTFRYDKVWSIWKLEFLRQNFLRKLFLRQILTGKWKLELLTLSSFSLKLIKWNELILILWIK